MSIDNVKCPKCGFKVPIAEILAEEIEANVRAESEAQWEAKEEQYKEEIEAGKKAAGEAIEKAKAQLEVKLRKEITSQNSVELQDLKADLESKAQALEEANEREMQFRKEKRELEEREKNLKLEVERTLDEERSKIQDKAAQEAEQSHRLKDLEKETKITQMLAQIEELKRKAEQGSQQTQGEVFEADLKESLQLIFSSDELTDVAVGVKGGDIVQVVKTRGGTEVGKILWELKRTKSFSEAWLIKLKADGRACKADICLLVSETLPDGIKEFAEIQGVWCASIATCIPLAHVLRTVLLKVAGERSVQAGKQSKAEMVYEYLTGIEFKGRIEAIVEAFRGMKDDLDSEKRAVDKMFAKREKQIQQVVFNLAGMHGELAALAGPALPSIKVLEYDKK